MFAIQTKIKKLKKKELLVLDPLLSGDKVYVGCNNLNGGSLRTNKTSLKEPNSFQVIKQKLQNIVLTYET